MLSRFCGLCDGDFNTGSCYCDQIREQKLEIKIKGELPESRIVFIKKAEAEFLDQMSKEYDIPESKVFIESLRFFQLCKVRGYLDEIMARERSL